MCVSGALLSPVKANTSAARRLEVKYFILFYSSGLPTVAIVTVTSSGAIISVVGVILVVYNIKLKKKQPIVQATSTTGKYMYIQNSNCVVYSADISDDFGTVPSWCFEEIFSLLLSG